MFITGLTSVFITGLTSVLSFYAATGSLHSRSMFVLGNAKLDSNRSQSAHQISVGSSSSDVEEVPDSPEKVLLAEELS